MIIDGNRCRIDMNIDIRYIVFLTYRKHSTRVENSLFSCFHRIAEITGWIGLVAENIWRR